MTNVQCSALRRPAIGSARTADNLVIQLLRLPLAIVETLLVWQERGNQRRHLASLDNRMLRDMGISRAEAEREAAIPFWRIS